MSAAATNKPASSNTPAVTSRYPSSDSRSRSCSRSRLRGRSRSPSNVSYSAESERRWYDQSNLDNCDDVCDATPPQSSPRDPSSPIDVQDCDDDGDDPTAHDSSRCAPNENKRVVDATSVEADRDDSPEYDPFDTTYSRAENRGRPFPRVPLWHLLLNHSGYI